MSFATTALLLIASIVALVWSALAIRLIRLSRGEFFHFLPPSNDPTSRPLTRVTAIVPARNEAGNVAATIRNLQAQDYPDLSIIVVDDQSTDATASIVETLASEAAADRPIRCLRGVERPEGWVGKTWAVHQGAKLADADWLWFVDADMGLDPRALTTAVISAEAAGADLVSLLPGVRCETFWQGTIAASFLQLLGQLYPLDRVNDPARPEAIAAGGFILVKRPAYWNAGGHEAVRRAIIEDIQLAQKIKGNGGKLLVRLAPSLVWTHMYGRFGDIWRGLRKNAYAGMEYQPHKYFVGAIIALGLAWAPWLAVLLGCWTWSGLACVIGLVGILAQLAATVPILVFLGLPFWFGLTLPAGISAYVAIASSSVWHHHRGRVLWKDRAISARMVESLTGTWVRGREKKWKLVRKSEAGIGKSSPT